MVGASHRSLTGTSMAWSDPRPSNFPGTVERRGGAHVGPTRPNPCRGAGRIAGQPFLTLRICPNPGGCARWLT